MIHLQKVIPDVEYEIDGDDILEVLGQEVWDALYNMALAHTDQMYDICDGDFKFKIDLLGGNHWAIDVLEEHIPNEIFLDNKIAICFYT